MTALPAPRDDDRGGLRASHDDREAVVEQLRDAAAEGRIDLDELDERLERALTAKTYAELDALTVDLPSPPAPADLPPLELKGGLHGASRGPGRWEVPAYVIARGGLAGVKLDLSRAECRLTEVTVEAYGEAAGVTIVLPDGWAADTTAMDPGIGGLKDTTTPDRLPGTPLIRVVGSGGMAGVVVRHPNRWERRKLANNPPRG
ncbi:DUF1707 domain-containing protein [Streptomyces sp. Vc74B-19]|uniref:DUF1707 SHOCT-like domain-containing protein n=1 Tax=unclassified Streptomyces TaxID=2593676 RepID=UPI001BFC4B54|nr:MULTISPECIES: DUF1707 domain-containing protein [unclassified Streptomyces]MBT3165474.1 DUF1707 domain-containing protein [Streptomyces sp. Vc74B-19]MCO4696862.1 hypothetical protein [Streptomyces sp. RO-S4]